MHDLFTTLSCLTACWQEDESDFLPGVYVCGNNGVIDEYFNSSHRRSILFLRQRSGRLTGFSCSEVGWRKTGRILRLSFVQRTILEENLKTVSRCSRRGTGCGLRWADASHASRRAAHPIWRGVGSRSGRRAIPMRSPVKPLHAFVENPLDFLARVEAVPVEPAGDRLDQRLVVPRHEPRPDPQ